jgi:hypothetical protein
MNLTTWLLSSTTFVGLVLVWPLLGEFPLKGFSQQGDGVMLRPLLSTTSKCLLFGLRLAYLGPLAVAQSVASVPV